MPCVSRTTSHDHEFMTNMMLHLSRHVGLECATCITHVCIDVHACTRMHDGHPIVSRELSVRFCDDAPGPMHVHSLLGHACSQAHVTQQQVASCNVTHCRRHFVTPSRAGGRRARPPPGMMKNTGATALSTYIVLYKRARAYVIRVSLLYMSYSHDIRRGHNPFGGGVLHPLPQVPALKLASVSCSAAVRWASVRVPRDENCVERAGGARRAQKQLPTHPPLLARVRACVCACVRVCVPRKCTCAIA